MSKVRKSVQTGLDGAGDRLTREVTTHINERKWKKGIPE